MNQFELLELCIKYPKVVDLLNKQSEQIKELEKEKQDLKDKAKIILDYYSRRYVNAIFNDRKHSKQFKSDLWSVKEVLYVLDLHDGDIDG